MAKLPHASAEMRAFDLVFRQRELAAGWRYTADILGSPRLWENQLLGKALAERHQQLAWAIEPNLPPQEGPHHVFFLPQKADPRVRVSGHVQIGLADMPLFHADLLFLNHDSCLPLLMAGERELEGGVQSRRLARLEDVWHSFQENLDGV